MQKETWHPTKSVNTGLGIMGANCVSAPCICEKGGSEQTVELGIDWQGPTKGKYSCMDFVAFL